MEAWFQRQWRSRTPWQLLLRPLSWLFALLSSVRRAAYRAGLVSSRHPGVPVIVIGNIRVGGAGKTPLALATVELLRARGYTPGIVTRGYVPGGATREPHAVDAGDALEGDEARLLAVRAGVPVFAGADRAAAAEGLLRAHPAVNVIVADDGLQHYRLRRDVEIAVVDARGAGNGALLPAGPLREPVSRLASVDAVVVNGGEPQGFVVPAFGMVLARESFHALAGEDLMDAATARDAFAGKRVRAVAGIGDPARFFDHLARLGISLSGTLAMRDHHAYVPADFAGLPEDVILMTEKDAVKCAAFADRRMWFLRVDAVLPAAYGDFLARHLAAPNQG